MTTLVALENIENDSQEITIKETMFTGLKEANAAAKSNL